MISVVTPCVTLERQRRSVRKRDDRVALDVDEAGADDQPGAVDDLAGHRVAVDQCDPAGATAAIRSPAMATSP